MLCSMITGIARYTSLTVARRASGEAKSAANRHMAIERYPPDGKKSLRQLDTNGRYRGSATGMVAGRSNNIGLAHA